MFALALKKRKLGHTKLRAHESRVRGLCEKHSKKMATYSLKEDVSEGTKPTL